MRSTGIHHVDLVVSSIERSLPFYRDLLGPLGWHGITEVEGEFDAGACTVECPRHGSLFDLRSGRPKTLPAYLPVETFEVTVENGVVKLET